MIKTGDILRKAREEKGFSLNEVALSLKISSKILNAIETGDEAQLPAKTFLRGFVQSYATYLRLDVDQVMTAFFEEVGSTKPKPLLKTAEPQKSIDENGEPTGARRNQDHLAPINQKSNTKALIATVIGIVLVALILFTKKMIDKYTKEAQVDSSVPVSEPLQNAGPTATPTPAPTLESSPAATDASGNMSTPPVEPSPSPSPVAPVLSNLAAIKAKASPAPSPSPAATASPSPAVTPIASTTPTPTPKPSPSVTPTAAPSPVASASPSVTPTPSPSPTASPTPDKAVSKPIELIIEALDNVEIEYSSNAGKKTSLKLNAEQVHTFKSKNGLKLSISNGGAVNLILNGRDLGIPGDLGKAINLSY